MSQDGSEDVAETTLCNKHHISQEYDIETTIVLNDNTDSEPERLVYKDNVIHDITSSKHQGLIYKKDALQMDDITSELHGLLYKDEPLAVVKKDNINIFLPEQVELDEKEQEDVSKPSQNIHDFQLLVDSAEQNSKEHTTSRSIPDSALLHVLEKSSVNLTSPYQKALVIYLDDSIYECQKHVRSDTCINKPFNLKVYSLSTGIIHGSQVTAIIKEKFSGAIPLNDDNITASLGKIYKSSSNNDRNTLNCTECPASFTAASQSKFDSHLKLHESQEGHVCQHCGRCFRRKNDVARHCRRMHSSEQIIYQCDACKKSYKDYRNFQLHVKAKHEGIYKYTCKDCGKGYNRLMEYKVHLSTHTGEKLYKCHLCSEEFLRKHYLTVHTRKHTGETPFWCSQCDKKFIDSSKLAHHKKVHVQFKDVLKKKQCSYCRKRFESKRDLETHERSHTGDRPFSCAICQKVYSAKSSLKEHQKVHGKRELQCSVCKKGFYKSFTLKEHMKIHTQEMPFICQYCAKRFRFGSNFRSHEKSCGKK